MSKISVTPTMGGGTGYPVVGTYTGKGSTNGYVSLTVPTEVKAVLIIGNGCFLAFRRGATYATEIGTGVAYGSTNIQMTRAKLTWSGTTVSIKRDQTVEFGSGSGDVKNNTTDQIVGWDTYSAPYIYIMF